MATVSPDRDLRLDLFRGLALWLIFLDHIPSNAVSWITIRNYGFSDATEIFVFISGYTAAFVYGRAMHEHGFIVAGARVLNLFAYTGTLGRACEAAGARAIWEVDRSTAALELGERVHVADPARHTWIAADVFAWLPALDPAERFDLVIVDPPSMTSRVAQVPEVLAAYRRLYRQVARHVAPGGAIAACCCTSRVARATFRSTVGGALGRAFALEAELPPEPDHPVGFPEADYLKITLWRRR